MNLVGSMSIRERAADALLKARHAKVQSKGNLEGSATHDRAPIVIEMRRRAIRLLDELLGIDASGATIPPPPADYFVVIDELWFSDVSHIFRNRSQGAIQATIWCSYHPGCRGSDKIVLTTEDDAWVALGAFLETHQEGWTCTAHGGLAD